MIPYRKSDFEKAVDRAETSRGNPVLPGWGAGHESLRHNRSSVASLLPLDPSHTVNARFADNLPGIRKDGRVSPTDDKDVTKEAKHSRAKKVLQLHQDVFGAQPKAEEPKGEEDGRASATASPPPPRKSMAAFLPDMSSRLLAPPPRDLSPALSPALSLESLAATPPEGHTPSKLPPLPLSRGGGSRGGGSLRASPLPAPFRVASRGSRPGSKLSSREGRRAHSRGSGEGGTPTRPGNARRRSRLANASRQSGDPRPGGPPPGGGGGSAEAGEEAGGVPGVPSPRPGPMESTAKVEAKRAGRQAAAAGQEGWHEAPARAMSPRVLPAAAGPEAAPAVAGSWEDLKDKTARKHQQMRFPAGKGVAKGVFQGAKEKAVFSGAGNRYFLPVDTEGKAQTPGPGGSVKYNYFDVTVPWDQEDPALDPSTYNLDAGVLRMYWSRRTVAEVAQKAAAEAWYRDYKEEPPRPVDLAKVAAFVAKLHPRSVLDFKPMFTLVQDLLRGLLEGKLVHILNERAVMEAEFNARLAALQAEYDAKLAEMERRLQEALAALASMQAERDALLDKLRAQQADSDSALEEQRRLLEERHAAEVAALQGQMAALQEELLATLGKVKDLEAQLAAKQKKIAELEAAGRAKDKRIAELEAAGRAKDQRIAELEAQMAARDARIAELEAAMQAQADRIAELEALLAQRDARLAELEELLRQLRRQVADLEASALRDQAELDRLRAEVARLEAAAGGGDNSDLLAQLEALRRQLAALEEQNRRLLEDNQRLQGENQRLAAENQRMQGLVDAANARAEAAESALRRAQGDLQALQARLDQATAALEAARAALASGSSDPGALAAVEVAMAAPAAADTGAMDRLQRDYDDLLARLRALEAELAARSAELAAARADLAAARADLAAAGRSTGRELELLFGEGGVWRMVRRREDLVHLAQLGLDVLRRAFALQGELTFLAFDHAHLSPRSPGPAEDLEYESSVPEVVLSLLGRQARERLGPEQSELHRRAARSGLVQPPPGAAAEAAPGGGAVCVASVVPDREGAGPWGCLELRGAPGGMRGARAAPAEAAAAAAAPPATCEPSDPVRGMDAVALLAYGLGRALTNMEAHDTDKLVSVVAEVDSSLGGDRSAELAAELTGAATDTMSDADLAVARTKHRKHRSFQQSVKLVRDALRFGNPAWERSLEISRKHAALSAARKKLEKMLMKPSMRREMAELCRYRTPTYSVATVITSLLLMLDKEDITDAMPWSELSQAHAVPQKGSNALQNLWITLKNHMNLDLLLRSMVQWSPEPSPPPAPAPDADPSAAPAGGAAAAEMRMGAVKVCLEAVDTKAAARGSKSAAAVREWVVVTSELRALAIEENAIRLKHHADREGGPALTRVASVAMKSPRREGRQEAIRE